MLRLGTWLTLAFVINNIGNRLFFNFMGLFKSIYTLTENNYKQNVSVLENVLMLWIPSEVSANDQRATVYF